MFRAGPDLGEAVAQKTDFDMTYVGDPLSELDLLITLEGVPKGSIINALQRRYYEKTIADFLRQNLDKALQSLVVPGQPHVIKSNVMVHVHSYVHVFGNCF